MRGLAPHLFIGAALSAIVLFTAGCEDTPLVAETGSTITVVASPATAQQDLSRDPSGDTYFTEIEALLLNMDSIPQPGRSVTFATQGGSFRYNVCSGGTCTLTQESCSPNTCTQIATGLITVETDAGGSAKVQLAVDAAAGSQVIVTAFSGGTSGMVTVTNPVGSNVPPLAVIDVSPNSPFDISGIPGQPTVTFSGLLSQDPDGDTITCYEWRITSPSQPAVVAYVQDPQFMETFARTEDVLDVKLRVTDDSEAAVDCDINQRWSTVAQEDYVICTNVAPTAMADLQASEMGMTTKQQTFLGQNVTFDLTAAGSDDPEGRTLTYEWDCDNGQTLQGEEVRCTYNAARTYDVELTVTDPGNPLSECSKSATDTISLTVEAPTP